MKFRKYEKTFRILMPDIDILGKRYLEPEEEKELFNGKVEITEKVDGGIMGIYKDFDGTIYFQKKGSAMDNSHAQYIYFLNQWAMTNYNLIKSLPSGMVYYGELMRCKHSIYYDELPNYVIFFDIYDMKEERYFEYHEMKQLCDTVGFEYVPLIYEGKITAKKHLEWLIPKASRFGTLAEGLVVKNRHNQMRGKIVKEQFIKMMDDHWRDKPVVFNKLTKKFIN